MKGLTYFRRNAFSINEGEYPNVHASYNLLPGMGFYFYLAITPRLKWRWLL